MVTAFIKILILVGSLFVGVTSVYILKMKPDNVVEEVCEEVIKEETGISLDLSPSSSEDKETKNTTDIKQPNVTI